MNLSLIGVLLVLAFALIGMPMLGYRFMYRLLPKEHPHKRIGRTVIVLGAILFAIFALLLITGIVPVSALLR